jgi:phenylpyruvate tautomerase PptA (4-oxalocrotonate tautomerase family)
MPHLQLDLPRRYPADVKRRLAQQLGALFANVMHTSQQKVVVAFMELPDGSLWRCNDGGVEPAAVIGCDMRHGRPPEQRARLSEQLIHACADALALDPACISVRFTEHAGDDFFRLAQGLGTDWTPTEAV